MSCNGWGVGHYFVYSFSIFCKYFFVNNKNPDKKIEIFYFILLILIQHKLVPVFALYSTQVISIVLLLLNIMLLYDYCQVFLFFFVCFILCIDAYLYFIYMENKKNILKKKKKFFLENKKNTIFFML